MKAKFPLRMNSRFYVIILVLFFQVKINAQHWIEIGHGLLPWGYSVDDVSAIGDSIVWVSASLQQSVEQPSILFLSTDGGQNWESNYLEECLHCKTVDLEAIDGTTAWMTTYSIHGGVDRLFKTTDGGQSWDIISTKPGSGGYIQLYDDDHVSCFDGRDVCWTEDGGDYFESGIVSTHSSGFLPYMAILGNTFGDTSWLGMAGQADLIYPGEAKLTRVTNYGRNFEFIDTGIDSISAISRVFFTDAMHGILVYEKWEYLFDFDFGHSWTYCLWECKDNIAVTNDGGQTWTSIEQPLDQLNNLYTVPGINGAYITTNHNSVAWTHNNGETWQTRKLHEYISSIDFTSPTTGYMGVNANNFSDPLLLKWNGDFTTSDEKPLVKPKLTIGPNPTNGLLHFDSEDETASSFHITIYDSNGKIAMAELVAGNAMSVEQLPSGLYFVNVKTREDSHVFKIIRQ